MYKELVQFLKPFKIFKLTDISEHQSTNWQNFNSCTKGVYVAPVSGYYKVDTIAMSGNKHQAMQSFIVQADANKPLNTAVHITRIK